MGRGAAMTANGMSGGYGGSWLRAKILGTAKAGQMYLIGDSAREALTFDLADARHEDDALTDVVLTLAARLATLDPTGPAYAKANLDAALDEGFAASLDRESLNTMGVRDALVALRKVAL